MPWTWSRGAVQSVTSGPRWDRRVLPVRLAVAGPDRSWAQDTHQPGGRVGGPAGRSGADRRVGGRGQDLAEGRGPRTFLKPGEHAHTVRRRPATGNPARVDRFPRPGPHDRRGPTRTASDVTQKLGEGPTRAGRDRHGPIGVAQQVNECRFCSSRWALRSTHKTAGGDMSRCMWTSDRIDPPGPASDIARWPSSSDDQQHRSDGSSGMGCRASPPLAHPSLRPVAVAGRQSR